MSTHQCSWRHGHTLISANLGSRLLTSVHEYSWCNSNECSWLLLRANEHFWLLVRAHKCVRALLSSHDQWWESTMSFLSSPDYSWVFLSICECYWAHLSAPELLWAWYHYIMGIHEHSWSHDPHLSVIMCKSTSFLCWTLSILPQVLTPKPQPNPFHHLRSWSHTYTFPSKFKH